MKQFPKVLAEILTEETAKLLDRLSDSAGMAYEYSLIGSRSGCNSDMYIEDEDAAYELAAKIRELLKGRTNE